MVFVNGINKIDERSNANANPHVGYVAPSIPLEGGSTNYYAIHGFIKNIDEHVTVHLMNEGIIDSPWIDDATGQFITNTGSSYRCDVFTLHAYDWDDTWADEAFDNTIGDIPPGYLHPNSDNFLDVETGAAVSWYKYMGREMCINQAMLDALNNNKLGEITNRIAASLAEIEEHNRSKS